jgi:hypothetical protein
MFIGYLSNSEYLQVSFGSYFNSQNSKRPGSRTMRRIPFRIVARLVARTGESICVTFHSAAEVGADQAQGGESIFGMNENCRRLR